MKIALVWDNFGPLHDDRLLETSDLLSGAADVYGVQITGKSDTYSWTNTGAYNKNSIFPGKSLSDISDSEMFFGTISFLLRHRIDAIFLCHYERLGTTLLAYALRFLGKKVYLMGCSKFDDKTRSSIREILKFPVVAPYQGALVGSVATEEYFRFIGLRGPITRGYNTVSTDRIRALAASAVAKEFAEKDFVIVARLVEKKNIFNAISAFSEFKKLHPGERRRLRICGDGPLEGALKAHCADLGVDDCVIFEGFLQSGDIACILSNACAILLVSTEEQFGNVIPEAFALGIPAIVSFQCGARIELIDSGLNGWVVEAENITGIARAMASTVRAERSWTEMSQAAFSSSWRGDVQRFAEGIRELVFGK